MPFNYGDDTGFYAVGGWGFKRVAIGGCRGSDCHPSRPVYNLEGQKGNLGFHVWHCPASVCVWCLPVGAEPIVESPGSCRDGTVPRNLAAVARLPSLLKLPLYCSFGPLPPADLNWEILHEVSTLQILLVLGSRIHLSTHGSGHPPRSRVPIPRRIIPLGTPTPSPYFGPRCHSCTRQRPILIGVHWALVVGVLWLLSSGCLFSLGCHVQVPPAGRNQKWPINGQGGYITPAASGIPTASKRGAKSELAHKWARWLHHPCRLGDPHRFKAGAGGG